MKDLSFHCAGQISTENPVEKANKKTKKTVTLKIDPLQIRQAAIEPNNIVNSYRVN